MTEQKVDDNDVLFDKLFDNFCEDRQEFKKLLDKIKLLNIKFKEGELEYKSLRDELLELYGERDRLKKKITENMFGDCS